MEGWRDGWIEEGEKDKEKVRTREGEKKKDKEKKGAVKEGGMDILH